MKIECSIDEQELMDVIGQKLDAVRVPCQEAMADAMYDMVMENMGQEDGAYRVVWKKDLNPKYVKWLQKKGKGRSFATLVLDGTLRDSVEKRSFTDYAEVFSDCDYAAAHQWGEGKMPQRTFFPMTNDGVSLKAQEVCKKACQNKLNELLSR